MVTATMVTVEWLLGKRAIITVTMVTVEWVLGTSSHGYSNHGYSRVGTWQE